MLLLEETLILYTKASVSILHLEASLNRVYPHPRCFPLKHKVSQWNIRLPMVPVTWTKIQVFLLVIYQRFFPYSKQNKGYLENRVCFFKHYLM